MDGYSIIQIHITDDEKNKPINIAYEWVGDSDLISVSRQFMKMALNRDYEPETDGVQIIVGGYCLEYVNGTDQTIVFRRVGVIGPWISKIGLSNPLVKEL